MTGLREAAVVLPGESGVRPGMVDVWLADPVAAAVVDETSEVVGRDVAAWWRDPAAAADPVATHLEVVVTGIAGYRSLAARGLAPVVVAGHGIGEYAALVAAGALELTQVVELVHWRAELLAHATRPGRAGAAAVVGPGAGDVARAAVDELSDAGPLRIACCDAPGQVVLAGTSEALTRARAVVEAAGLVLVPLPGRAPCHSPLVQPVADHLAAALADLDWSVPAVCVVPNVDGEPTLDPDRLATRLRHHLTSPVQWEATSRSLVAAGATAVVEIGAVPVLGRLVRQVHPDLPISLAAGPGASVPTDPPELALAGTVPTRGER
ncbi:ACP S-malonyltransferase [Blastococcus sp. VKM Ac-2987]|uniref:ACP S-malonyltransferase n=1 Tax=Blastococcus sp. VKM Ac-2987 TaxID=3004141 RepID=UPI0022AB7B79|nr:ACP S-malonyltransferase [Blastococcus sp. VKM Ac-2987]MCZ2858695.1 ACP S-malonyltransferase [Blastococcus sp. VKM Ac-2987]